MAFEDYKTKDSVTLVYTGEGKGKTSASIGLLARALGADWRVAFIQFVKYWPTRAVSYAVLLEVYEPSSVSPVLGFFTIREPNIPLASKKPITSSDQPVEI